MVVVALIPCILMALYNTGYQANLVIQHSGVENPEGWRASILFNVGHRIQSWKPHRKHRAWCTLLLSRFSRLQYRRRGFWEVIFSCVRKHEINEGFLVTGMLFPLILPPTIPLWQVAVGISFAVIFAKEVYGGTGKNIPSTLQLTRTSIFILRIPRTN